VLNLDFADLPIVNGTTNDINSNRPFNTHFTRRKFCGRGQRLALCHLQARRCLDNKRVRKELLGQRKEDTGLKELTTLLQHSGLFDRR
jgi:hypothetical protein